MHHRGPHCAASWSLGPDGQRTTPPQRDPRTTECCPHCGPTSDPDALRHSLRMHGKDGGVAPGAAANSDPIHTVCNSPPLLRPGTLRHSILQSMHAARHSRCPCPDDSTLCRHVHDHGLSTCNAQCAWYRHTPCPESSQGRSCGTVPAWWSLTVQYSGNPAQLEKMECEQTSEWACQAHAHRVGVCNVTGLVSVPPRLDVAEEVEPDHRPRGPRLCSAHNLAQILSGDRGCRHCQERNGWRDHPRPQEGECSGDAKRQQAGNLPQQQTT